MTSNYCFFTYLCHLVTAWFLMSVFGLSLHDAPYPMCLPFLIWGTMFEKFSFHCSSSFIVLHLTRSRVSMLCLRLAMSV